MASLSRFFRSPHVLATAGLLLFSVVFYWPLLDFFQLNLEDEGNLLFPALNILHGKVPYQDFILVVSPGVYYILALWLKIFGATFAAARAFAIFVQALSLVLLYFIGSRLIGPKLAFAAALLMGFTSMTHWPIASHHWVGLASFLLTVLCCQFLLERPESVPRALVAGGAAAATGLMLQSPGACAILLCFATALLACPKVGAKGALKMCLFGILGALVAGLPLLLWLVLQVGIDPLLEHLVWGHFSSDDGRLQYESIPFVFFPTSSALKTWHYFQSQSWSQVWAQKGLLVGLVSWPVSHLLTHGLFYPLTLLFAVGAWFVKDVEKRREIALLAVAGVLSSLTAYYRPDVPHVAFSRHVWWVLMLYFVVSGLRAMDRFPRRILTGFLVILAIPVSWYGVHQRMSFSSRPSYFVGLPNGILRTKNARLASNLKAYSEYLKTLDTERPKMFVYPIMPILYFLSNGENVTMYERLAPVLFPQEAFENALGSLQATPPDFLVLLDMNFDAYHRSYPLLDKDKMVEIDEEFRAKMQKIPTTFVRIWPGFEVR